MVILVILALKGGPVTVTHYDYNIFQAIPYFIVLILAMIGINNPLWRAASGSGIPGGDIEYGYIPKSLLSLSAAGIRGAIDSFGWEKFYIWRM